MLDSEDGLGHGKESPSIEDELKGAIAAGKAPQFEVMALDFHKKRWQMGGTTDSRYSVTLQMLLDGQPIHVVDEQIVNHKKRGIAFEGRLGSVDLMERALREAILKRWPKLKPYLQEIKIAGYSVMAVGDESSHHVRVGFQVICRKGKQPRAIVCEGVDSVGATFDALVTIFHWTTWRILRRLRGEERCNAKF